MEEATREPKVLKFPTKAAEEIQPTKGFGWPIPSNIDLRARSNFREDESLYDNVPADAQGLSTLVNIIMPNDKTTNQDDPETYENIAIDTITTPSESTSTML